LVEIQNDYVVPQSVFTYCAFLTKRPRDSVAIRVLCHIRAYDYKFCRDKRGLINKLYKCCKSDKVNHLEDMINRYKNDTSELERLLQNYEYIYIKVL
jgi:hypothetical protein